MITAAELITEPSDTAISIDSLKTHLRIDNDVEDDLLEALIFAATERVEEYISMKLIVQRWAVYWDNFYTRKKHEPWWDGVREMAVSALYADSAILELPFGKVYGDAYEFTTFDQTNAPYVFDDTLYIVDTKSKQSRIALKMGQTWPSTVLAPVNGIKFEADYGFGTAENNIPNSIKQALLITCASFYENKGDDSYEMTLPPTAMFLLAPYKSVRI